MSPNNQSTKVNFDDVVPPVETYGHTGNPYKSVLETLKQNIETQNKLNTTHGGKKKKKTQRKKKKKKKKTQRKRVYKGGSIVIPQAPTTGSKPFGPNTGNNLAKNVSQTLINLAEQSKYDNQVDIDNNSNSPTNQSGGSLKSRLKQLL
jgi:hypothetical protein